MSETQANNATQKPPKRRKVGRPKYEPSESDRQKVIELAAFGDSQKEIARKLRIGAPTLRKYFLKELRISPEDAEQNVLASMYGLATDPSKRNLAAIKAYLQIDPEDPVVLASLYSVATDPAKPSALAQKLYLEVACGVVFQEDKTPMGKKEMTEESAKKAAEGIFTSVAPPPHLIVDNG